MQLLAPVAFAADTQLPASWPNAMLDLEMAGAIERDDSESPAAASKDVRAMKQGLVAKSKPWAPEAPGKRPGF